MDLKTILEQKSKVAWEIYIPSLSIDCVVFGFDKTSLKVLTLKMKDRDLWAMPGGYIRKDEDLHDAASRILVERTGAQNIYLQQFRVFGDINRTENFFEGFDDNLWHKQRFLSIGFYALVDYTKVNLVVDDTSDACQWMSINEIPKLMMDHQSILDKALLRLRKELNHKPIGLNLLPEKFTFPELQKLYEVILDKKLNRGNFYRKILRYNILEKLDESRKGGAHKAPDLYRFDTVNYQNALKNGYNEGW